MPFLSRSPNQQHQSTWPRTHVREFRVDKINGNLKIGRFKKNSIICPCWRCLFNAGSSGKRWCRWRERWSWTCRLTSELSLFVHRVLLHNDSSPKKLQFIYSNVYHIIFPRASCSNGIFIYNFHSLCNFYHLLWQGSRYANILMTFSYFIKEKSFCRWSFRFLE